MRTAVLIRLVLVMSLASVTAARAATIVCLGDSLTAGRGLAEEEAFPALVEALAKADGHTWTVVNAGISGDSTAGGLSRVAWALKAKPDLVLVALGGNDGLRGLPLAKTRENLEAIVDKLRAGGATVAIAGMMLPVNYGEDYRTGFAKLFPEVAESRKAPLMPFLLEGVGGKPELNQADGIHPTAEGQRIVAAHVYTFLKPLLDPPATAAAPKAQPVVPVGSPDAKHAVEDAVKSPEHEK